MENDRRGKTNPHASDPTGATSILERRRLAKVVHDDRGNAQVKWVDAPPDHERVQLSLEDETDAGSKRPGAGYDPYQKAAKARLGGPEPPERPAKRDLRKLSDWIKQMRELEARKQRDED